jgi:hypothetical protein
MMTATNGDRRTLTEVASELVQDSAKLAGHLYMLDPTTDLTPVHDLRDRMMATAETLGSSGIGDVHAAGPTRGDVHNVADLTAAMAADVAKVAVGLHGAGVEQSAIGRLQDDAAQLVEAAALMHLYVPDFANQDVVNFSANKPNTKRLEGKLPGERVTTLDQAARKLENRLRHDRLNRRPEQSLHPVERVGLHMGQKAYGAVGTAEGRQVGGTNIDQLNQMAAAKREDRRPRGPRPYEPPAEYTEPERRIYRRR